MSPAAARELIARSAPEGERWVLHSRQVARVARLLGERLAAVGAEVDPELLEVQGLLHDLGRSRTHGPLHGWTGFVMLRSRGLHAEARGCIGHWLKGRPAPELLAAGFRPAFVRRLVEAFDPESWQLSDSVVSVADASVRHSTIVSLEDREADLYERYGRSPWLQRSAELARVQAAQIEAELGEPLPRLLASLYGDTLS